MGQSERSACGIFITPRTRDMNRAQWKSLWRYTRMVWHATAKAQQEATMNAMIFGQGYVEYISQPETDGLRQQLPYRAKSIDPMKVFKRR